MYEDPIDLITIWSLKTSKNQPGLKVFSSSFCKVRVFFDSEDKVIDRQDFVNTEE